MYYRIALESLRGPYLFAIGQWRFGTQIKSTLMSFRLQTFHWEPYWVTGTSYGLLLRDLTDSTDSKAEGLFGDR